MENVPVLDIPCSVRQQIGYFLEPIQYPGNIMLTPVRKPTLSGEP